MHTDLPTYTSAVTLDNGNIALESFVSFGANQIKGETQRLLIHMN